MEAPRKELPRDVPWVWRASWTKRLGLRLSGKEETRLPGIEHHLQRDQKYKDPNMHLQPLPTTNCPGQI
jgi:hypothetical protein